MKQMIPFFLVSTLTFTILVGCGGDNYNIRLRKYLFKALTNKTSQLW